MEEFIERKIVIGFITSTEFLQKIQPLWKSRYMQSILTKHISRWCWEYYQKYNKAPGKDIDGILYRKSQAGISADLLEEIEEDILPSLSEEYMAGDWDISYLLEQTKKYISERRLSLLADDIKAQLAENELLAAENLATSYRPGIDDTTQALDLSSGKAVTVLKHAFDYTYTNIIEYPRELGKMWNSQLVKGGFVSLLAPEKRGKTFMLMDMAIRAVRQGKRAAFFQAGDMTESQFMVRIAIHLAKKSNLEKYAGKVYEPVRDCVLNQIGACDKPEREGNVEVFPERIPEQMKKELEFDDIKEALKDEPDYKPCHNCSEYITKRLGNVWMRQVNVGDVLSAQEAVKHWRKFFRRYKHRFKLSTHANGTLAVKDIKALLDIWEREGFLPDVIIIDYADLLEPDLPGKDFRHQQNYIWKALRGISQEKNEPLVITATQADAASYDVKSLRMKNFSEDKRKFAHVTAMYGLNQDPSGREKKLGILRINEILVREGAFDTNNQVYVLQNLARGLSVLSSYI
jgi:hypothetical protein